MNGWMNLWMLWMDGRMDRINECIDGWLGWIDEWLEGLIDEWLEGWIDEWLEGWMNVCM
jgi:hypothetical protein